MVEPVRGSQGPEIGVLPSGWNWVQLGDVASLVMGQSPPSNTYNVEREGLPFLQGKAEFGEVYPLPVKWTSAPLKVSPKEAVLISVRAPVGDVNLTPDKCCIGRGLAAIVPSAQVDLSYVFFYLKFSKTRFEEQGSGSTFKSINKNVLREFLLPLPPLEEQRSIAHFLHTVQEAKEATEKVIASAREMKRSLMEHLFTYGPVPVEEADQVSLKETEIGMVPEHWNMARVDEVATLFSGGTPSKKREDYWLGDIPWASPKDIKHERLSETQDHISQEALESGSRLAPADAVLIVVRGMILAKDVPLSLTTKPMAFNQDLKAILPVQGFVPEYLLYALKAQKKSLAKEIGTSAHGTKRLGTSAISEWKIALPTLPEQHQIADILRVAGEKIAAEENRKKALKVLFDSLLHDLMIGKVRVGDVNLSRTEEVMR